MAGIAPSAARGGPRAWCGARDGRSRRSCGDWERRRAADRQAGLRCWPAGDEQDGDRSVVDQAVGHAADEPRSARGRCRGGRRRSPPLRALRPRFTAPQTPATESAAATTASASKPARAAALTPSAAAPRDATDDPRLCAVTAPGRRGWRGARAAPAAPRRAPHHAARRGRAGGTGPRVPGRTGEQSLPVLEPVP